MTSLRQRLRLKRHALKSCVRCIYGLPRSLGKYWNPWTQWTTEQRHAFVRIAGETMVRCGLATGDELELRVEGPMHAPLGGPP